MTVYLFGVAAAAILAAALHTNLGRLRLWLAVAFVCDVVALVTL